MKSERIEKWWCGFEWCILNTQKVWSSNKFKKMKSLCNRRVWYHCPFCTRSASSFCRNPLNFLAHAMWMKWWYHANFQPFQSSFEMLFNFRVLYLKIISKCMKNNRPKIKNYATYWATTAWIRLETHPWARIQARRRPSRPTGMYREVRPVSLL